MTRPETTTAPKVSLRNLAPALAQRLLFGLITLTAIVFLTFFGLDMARGQPFQESVLAGTIRTGSYTAQAVQGDLGSTVAYGYSRLPTAIAEILPEIALRSLGLLTGSLFLSALLGVGLGVWSARRNGSLSSLFMLLGSIVGLSLPSFFTALLLQLLMIQLRNITGRTILPIGGFGWDTHMLLPAIVLAARPMAQIARVTSVTLENVLSKDFIRTAYSKGLTNRAVMLWHATRNAAIPVLTTIGLSLRFSLSSLPVVEFFFGWQGLGYHLLKAISARDDELAVAMLICLGGFFILVNLLLEISYRFIDPRLREGMEHAARERLSLLESLQTFPETLRSFVSDNPISNWLRSRRRPPLENPFREILEKKDLEARQKEQLLARGNRRAWLGGTLKNPAFLLGSAAVFVLAIVVLFGTSLAPHSPYTTIGLEFEEGEFTVPPFPPDEEYTLGTDMLGRDVLSLILVGAQQTFLLVSLAVIARLLVGFALGAIAGWWNGSWLDRTLLAAAEIIATFPTLLLVMNLILALNIRNGMPPFIIALCFVGWGELMQFVRGEVMRLQPALFVENAIATGVRTTRILFSHVLPNIIPALISLTALEMGAVLMLLGELGFVGIFIGGGIFAEMEWMTFLFHYSDVPEWGAMLSNVRTYARSFPWMAIYPSLAFFFAILGLNLFGEGLRLLVDRVGVRILGIFNRYTTAAGLIAVAAFVSWRGSTGALTIYSRQAEAFDGTRAMSNLEALTLPIAEGRALGSMGMNVSAQWIAGQFESMGIQAGGEQFTYFQERSRGYQTLVAKPVLAVEDDGPPLVYQQDFNAFPANYRIAGAAMGQVRFLALGDVSSYERYGYRYDNLPKRDFSEEILLVLEDDVPYLEQMRHKGTLVVASDPSVLKRLYTLSSNVAGWQYRAAQRGEKVGVPSLWISEATANRLLKDTNFTVDDLRTKERDLKTDEFFELSLDVPVAMYIEGQLQEHVSVYHVIGHLPGTVSNEFAGIDDRLIVVLAQYDCPPLGFDETPLQCANDNASGVAVMLEAIRTMQATGYQPYKTFLFIAYSGEGTEGGASVGPEDIDQFLEARFGFLGAYEPEAIIQIRGLGRNQGAGLNITSVGSLRLAKLFESVARRLNLHTQITGDRMNLSRIFSPGTASESGEEAPRVRLTWDGWDQTARTVDDTLGALSQEDLEQAGEALTLTLMIAGREINY
jgi:peptide/nickel transport system permease protein